MLAHRHYSEQTVDMERVLLLILVGFFVGFFYSTFIFIHFFYFFPFAFLFLSFLCNFQKFTSFMALWDYYCWSTAPQRASKAIIGPICLILDIYCTQDQYSKTFETVSLFTRCFFFICLPALLTFLLISFLNL